jgi:hypothetical protein
LSSLTQPLTVVLFPMSSNAIADKAHTKQNARQIARTFLMPVSPLLKFQLRPQTAKRRRSHPQRPTVPLICEMKLGKYTTTAAWDCQSTTRINLSELHAGQITGLLFR